MKAYIKKQFMRIYRNCQVLHWHWARFCRYFEQGLTAVDLVYLHPGSEIIVGVAQLCFQRQSWWAEGVKQFAQQHDGPRVRGIAKSKVYIVQRTMLNHPVMERSQAK